MPHDSLPLDDALPLAADFPSVAEDQWLAAVDVALRGAPFDKLLISHTADGIPIEPLYDRANHGALLPAADGVTRGLPGAGGWDIRQRHDLGDPAETNAAILADLEQGATSVLLRLRHKPTVDAFTAALKGVHLSMAPVALDAGPWAADVAPMLVGLWDAQGIDVADRIGALRIDPLGAMARYGAAIPESLGSVGMHQASPGVTTMAVDATPYADGGASAAFEVGASLATGVEYLRWLTGAGMSIDEAAAQIEFTYTATANQFETIAKLRAARRTWARVLSASGGSANRQTQHAITASSMFSTRDPWVNLLRMTIAAFAAGAGGAQAVTVLPFDSAIGVPAELGRRTARNISLLLLEESHVGHVTDPAGGSYFVESLTEALAERAWQMLQHIESVGGMQVALATGQIQTEIERGWDEARIRIASRKEPIVGVSEFPNLDETPIEREPLQELGRYDIDPTIIPIPLRRQAEDFEALRDAADLGRTSNHQAPLVFAVPLGPPSVHSPRLGFARNFFAAGGIGLWMDEEAEEGYDEPGDALDALGKSGARVAVICSSDEVYADTAEAAAAVLKGAGCDRVILAGHPGAARPGLERAGVDSFIHVGSNVVEELRAIHQLFGLTGKASA